MNRSRPAPKTLLLLCLSALALYTGCASGPTPTTAGPEAIARMAGQMIMVGFRGRRIPESHPLATDLRERNLGGVVLFEYDALQGRWDRNIKNAAQLKALTGDIRKWGGDSVLIAIDQEGGLVERLNKRNGYPEWPSHATLGRGPLRRTRSAAFSIGTELTDAGINLNFAPVADVNVTPKSPAIGAKNRSFSPNAEITANQALAFGRGLLDAKVLPTFKHFPGHGSAEDDSHQGVTDITDTWQERELIPYKKFIATNEPGLIMAGHLTNRNLDPEAPATLSAPIITGLLRNQLGFSGVVITDDLQMKAISRKYGLRETVKKVILSGCDILLFANTQVYDPELTRKVEEIIVDLVRTKEIPESRIKESWIRIRDLKMQLNAL